MNHSFYESLASGQHELLETLFPKRGDILMRDHATGEFFVAGKGQVTDDGAQIVTIEGGIQEASWHFPIPGPPSVDGSDNNDDNRDCKCPPRQTIPSGSETAIASGDLVEEHTLVGYRSLTTNRSLRLIYHSINADPRPLVNSRTTIPNEEPPAAAMARGWRSRRRPSLAQSVTSPATPVPVKTRSNRPFL